MITSGNYLSRERRSMTSSWTPDKYAQESVITVAADDLPVTLADAKKWLRVNHNEDNNEIETLIQAVTLQIERRIGRDLMQKTRKELWTKWGRELYLTYFPVQSVTSVTSYAIDGTATVLTVDTDYYVRGLEHKYIELTNATDASYIEIVYVSGKATKADIDGKYKAAIFQELSAQYKNRQSSADGVIAIQNDLTVQTRMLLANDILENDL